MVFCETKPKCYGQALEIMEIRTFCTNIYVSTTDQCNLPQSTRLLTRTLAFNKILASIFFTHGPVSSEGNIVRQKCISCV